jgi:hypothetical protein
MSGESWAVVIEVSGELQANILRNLFEAQGIKVFLNQEGAGRAYGLTVGPLGQVQVMVPEHQIQEASQIVDDYYAGKLEGDYEAGIDENEEQSD